MMYVNEEGNPADLVPSSFDEEIELNSSVSIEFLLEHNITSIYSLARRRKPSRFCRSCC